MGLVEYFIRVFMAVICVFIVLSEVGDDILLLCGDAMMMYPSWIVRGTIYLLLGVIGISQWETAENYDYGKVVVGYICAVSWMMIVAGIMYTLSGILCCQKVDERVMEDYKKRCERSQSLRKKVEKRVV